jgi:hypothetical protein
MMQHCMERMRSTRALDANIPESVCACVRDTVWGLAPILGVSRLTTAALVASVFAMLSDGSPAVVVADEAFAA